MVTLEKDDGDDGGSSSIPTKRMQRTSKLNREGETETPHSTVAPTENETDLAETERPPHSTAALTEHETDRPEAEIPPPRSTVSPTEPEQPLGSSTRSPSPKLQEEDDEEVGSTDAGAPQAAENMAVEPIRPNKFFFKPKDYWKSCKLQSRCHQHKFMTTLKGLDESEKRWFLEHPQFKHLFHMVCTPTRKVMGLWMLLIRTIVTHKSRQAWFAVNGVPIRYSIREHGLISGLYCHQYPENYKSRLSMKFAEKQFRKMFMKKLKKKKKNPEEEELKEISSILGPIEREQQVIYQTMDEECWGDMELLDDGDDHDAIQLEEEHEAGNEHEVVNESERIHGGEPVADLESLKEMVVSLMSQMTTMEGKINNKLEDLDRRLEVLEGDSIGIGNMEFQYYHNEDGGTSGQKDKEKEHEDEEAEEDAEKDGNELEDEEAAKKPEESEDEEAAKEHEEIEENEKDDGKELQKELQKEESEKEFEVQPEKEAAAAEKRVSKRVPKLSHLQKSPFVKK
ncbi:hypothetical protein Bca52824_021985 [Brassica carinata]|uniref:DUF1985 domain-containing protein n=1 Tax=Brassica carinata TaxID=52824 RepID=A0A8X7VF99_BRACI|nr:hypothetical protein Bca52824_021985 [Brassica carinata]